jgi:HlyD family secretion protein
MKIPSKPRKPVVAVVVLAAVGLLAWRFLVAGAEPSDGLFASGSVEATEALVGFQRAGRIESVPVREGDMVRSGQVLAQLDTTELQTRRRQALAQAAAARAQLAQLESGARPEEVAQARAEAEGAASRTANALRELQRAQTLFDAGVISRQDYESTRTAAEVAESQRRQAQEQLNLVRKGPREEEIAAQRARLAHAEAAVAEIDAALDDATVRAPFDGVVTVQHREAGEVVSPGLPAITLRNHQDRWVRIYVPGNRIATVRLGTPAVITTDTYPRKEYRGTVSFIASEAEFTPKTVQTQEERVKLVYAVKVRVTDDPAFDLKPGMPADVRLEVADDAR